MMDGRRGWERVAGTAMIVAAGVHGSLTSTHFAQWWGYGAFFLVATVWQAVIGLALALDALEAPKARTRSLLYATGAVGNALLVSLYVVTRTVGIPFFGPDAGLVEGVGALDLVSKGAEVVAIVALARLLCDVRPSGRPSPG